MTRGFLVALNLATAGLWTAAARTIIVEALIAQPLFNSNADQFIFFSGRPTTLYSYAVLPSGHIFQP